MTSHVGGAVSPWRGGAPKYGPKSYAGPGGHFGAVKWRDRKYLCPCIKIFSLSLQDIRLCVYTTHELSWNTNCALAREGSKIVKKGHFWAFLDLPIFENSPLFLGVFLLSREGQKWPFLTLRKVGVFRFFDPAKRPIFRVFWRFLALFRGTQKTAFSRCLQCMMFCYHTYELQLLKTRTWTQKWRFAVLGAP